MNEYEDKENQDNLWTQIEAQFKEETDQAGPGRTEKTQHIVRNFPKKNTYAMIFCQTDYDQLRLIEGAESFDDLPAVNNDFENAKTTIENLAIPPENVFYFTRQSVSDETIIDGQSWKNLKV